MLIAHRYLKPFLILSVTLTGSCLSLPAEPEPEPDAASQASIAEQDVLSSPGPVDDYDDLDDPDDHYTEGGHCNVRLTRCNPYPLGKGKHPRADAICSLACVDTIAYCKDYTAEEVAWCCDHPSQNYRGDPKKPCQISGEPLWDTRCEPGLNP